jgi:CRP-like cAMP-binding protein
MRTVSLGGEAHDQRSITGHLARTELFGGLAPEALERLAALGELCSLEPGSPVIIQGERSRTVFVILQGEGRLSIDGRDLRGVGPGDCVGELSALDGSPRSASVTTTTAMQLLSFTADAFNALLADVPVLRERLVTDLGRRLRELSDGWAGLAADTDLLLEALVSLQRSDGTPASTDRSLLIQHAVELLERAAAAGVAEETSMSSRSDARALLDRLTPAERRVAELVADGLSNAAVAAELFVSHHTVESHLKHAYVKLGIRSRVALATLVLRSR